MSYNTSNNSNSNYPTMSQSEWDDAPFNQPLEQTEEVEVTISMTLSKSVKVTMDVRKKERGYYSDYDLREAVTEQLDLSNINIDDYYIDDFEVIKE